MNNRFVYFDLGNVLVHFDHEIAVRQLAQLAQCSLEQSRQVIFGSGLEDRYEMGAVSSSEFATTINQSLKSQLSQSSIIEAVSAIFRPNEAILEALAHIRSAGIPMAVLSNTCEGHWLWLLRRQWPMIEGWFEFHMLSYELKSMKPAPAIYAACEERCGRQPQDIFFTDDRAENIQAAANRGWGTYQFGNVPQLIAAFDAWVNS